MSDMQDKAISDAAKAVAKEMFDFASASNMPEESWRARLIYKSFDAAVERFRAELNKWMLAYKKEAREKEFARIEASIMEFRKVTSSHEDDAG